MSRIAQSLLALALSAVAGGAFGQDDVDGGSLDGRLEQMEQDMNLLREDNQSLRQALDQLRAETDDNWLTEERADQIRNLVGEVLADADTRASLMQNGMTAGWSDHFFLASSDGRFKLEFGGQLQTRFVFNATDSSPGFDRYRYGFEVPRAILNFGGHVFGPDIQYLIRLNVTRDEIGLVDGIELPLDMWSRFVISNEWSVKVGQFRVPFNYEELVYSANQQAVERSLVNQNMNVGRSQGVEVTYAGNYDKWNFALLDAMTDNLGGFGLVGTNPIGGNTGALNRDTEFAVATRWEHLFEGNWRQFRQFTSPPGEEKGSMLGVAAFYQQGEYDSAPSSRRNEERWFGATVDYSMQFGGANIFASVIYHYLDSVFMSGVAPALNANVVGVVLQGGFYFTQKWEGFARWEYGWWDFQNQGFADLNELTVGANYYIDGQDLKWSTDLGVSFGIIDQNWDSDLAGWRSQPRGSEPQFVLRSQIQLLF